MLRKNTMKKQLIMKKKMTRKTNTYNKMKNIVKMDIMINMSRKRDGKKMERKEIKMKNKKKTNW